MPMHYYTSYLSWVASFFVDDRATVW